MMYKFILLLCTILLLWIVYFYYENHIINKKNFSNIVRESYFFNNLTPIDLYARKCTYIKDYRTRYIESYRSFTLYQKYQLRHLISHVNAIIKKYTILSSISWKFVKVTNDIENGYPHTLGKIIILTDIFFTLPYNKKISVLIHEKIHLYQRLYTHKCQDLICNMWNYIPINFSKNYKLFRSNPDLNGIVYKKDNIITIQVYKSNRPKSIADSKLVNIDVNNNIINKNIHPSYINQPEHPYEIQACLITSIILDSLQVNDYFIEKTKTWINDNF